MIGTFKTLFQSFGAWFDAMEPRERDEFVTEMMLIAMLPFNIWAAKHYMRKRNASRAEQAIYLALGTMSARQTMTNLRVKRALNRIEKRVERPPLEVRL